MTSVISNCMFIIPTMCWVMQATSSRARMRSGFSLVRMAATCIAWCVRVTFAIHRHFFCFPPMRFSFVSSSSTRIIPIFVPINQLFDSETTQLKTKSMAIKANTSYLQGILSCPSVAGSFIVHFFRSFPAYLSIFKTNNLHIRCQLLPPPYALVSGCNPAGCRRLYFTSSVGVRHTPCVRMLPVPFLYLKIRPFLQSHSPGINRHKSVPYTPLGKAG